MAWAITTALLTRGAVTAGAGLRRYAARDLWALAAALDGALAALGGLLPLRATWSSSNVALLLVVVVVTVAGAGNRAAGALAAVGAAVWFDFFFILPYYRLTIRSSDDVTTAVLLLVTGPAVSQLAAWARGLKVTAVTGEGYLATMHGTAALAQPSAAAGIRRQHRRRPAHQGYRECRPARRTGAPGVRQRPVSRPVPDAATARREADGARLVAVALAEQIGHAYSAARVSGTEVSARCQQYRTHGDARKGE